MKRKVNLKKRLDELRDEPEPQIELTLMLDADLIKELKIYARRKRQTVEAYIGDLLAKHVEDRAE